MWRSRNKEKGTANEVITIIIQNIDGQDKKCSKDNKALEIEKV